MKRIKVINLFILVLLGSTSVFGQVPQKVVVEHFTNTRCGICASRNPGFLNNLRNFPDAIHMSVHPSSPYSSCVLNQHNRDGNDSRTRYYGIYGSTPRIAVQGKALSASTNYGSASIFNDPSGQMSPISISLKTMKHGGDSMVVRVVLKTEMAHTLGELNLFVPAVEDTVFYNAPNGEKTHYNVFRKAMIDQKVTLSKTAGDSMVYYARTANHMDWDAKRMYAIAILQGSDKAVVQVESNKDEEKKQVLSVSKKDINSQFNVYPVPARNLVTITGPGSASYNYEILNLRGDIVLQNEAQGSTNVSINSLSNGVYFVRAVTDKGVAVKRIIKQ